MRISYTDEQKIKQLRCRSKVGQLNNIRLCPDRQDINIERLNGIKRSEKELDRHVNDLTIG